MQASQDVQSSAYSKMALPSKIYSNFSYNSTSTSPVGFTFLTRDSAQEMSYTAQTLAELMKTDGYWAEAETNAGTVLKDRYISAVSSVGSEAKTQFDNLKNALKTELYGSTSASESVGYSQFLAGMSAAMGGGHANVDYFKTVVTNKQQLDVYQTAASVAQTVVGNAFTASSAMPLVVPLESQLISDAHASAVESHNIGTIRAQQIRQSIAAGNQLSVGVTVGTDVFPSFDEIVAAASINAQGAAARQT